MSSTRSRLRILVPFLSLALLSAACGSDGDSKSADTTAKRAPITLRIGYLPDVTQAPAMFGLRTDTFAEALGSHVTVKSSVFNAGPAAVDALFAKDIDAAFVGPNAAITAFSKSDRKAIRIVAGTASGGAFLVVQPDIRTVSDLKGRKVATPQLGNTQDVALRYWLKGQGLTSDLNGGGDVSVVPQDNSTAVTAFQQGAIAGAWVPEPYATRLIEAGGHVLVDERDLWPDGEYATTLLVVRLEYLFAHPDVVRSLIEGLSQSVDLIENDPETAAGVVSEGIEAVTGKPLAVDLVTKSFENITFTLDPITSSVLADAEHAIAVGTLEQADLTTIFSITILNTVLTKAGKERVPSPQFGP